MNRSVYFWLISVFVMVLTMIVIGAITRLTDSGLSMVEWRPIYGFLPPLTDTEWQRVFNLYQQIPEYQYQNKSMSLSEFRYIFFWEYFHRLWGRLIGITYGLPLLYFWLRNQLPLQFKPRLLALLFLGGLQGVIGWWMVKSGLTERLDVSAFRLMVHLGGALIILLLLWGMLQQRFKQTVVSRETISQFNKIAAWGMLLFTYITVLSGALVAGNDAGLMYNDWPLMNGAWVANEYSPTSFSGWFENAATVQFHHRMMAYLCVIFIGMYVWCLSRQRYFKRIRFKQQSVALLVVVSVQIVLGIATLISIGNVLLAVLHHSNALLLLLLVSRLTHPFRR